MIRLQIKKGVQTLTEVCDHCKCHIRNLTTDDIIVNKTNMIIKDSKGRVVERKEARPKCYCEHCSHE